MGANTKQLKVGLFAIGLEAYWSQFPGLRERLLGYTTQISRRLAETGTQVVDLGLIDTAEKALEAGHAIRRADVDLIVLHVSTYALSSTVLPAVRRARVPVVLLNLSPTPAIDYESFNAMADRTKMTAEWLAYCSACPVPEIANVFTRCGIPFFQVHGTLENDPGAWRDILEWVEAAGVAYSMEHNRLGLMGHYYGGMLDVYSDLTQHIAHFGGHVEIIEVDELAALRRSVTSEATQQRIAEFQEHFDIQADCLPEEIERSARTSVALDQLAEAYSLGSLAYYYRGAENSDNEDVISSIILGTSLLTSRGIPVAGEYEINNVQAMKIMDSFGVGGSFTEYYAADYQDDVLLMGHDGPGHIAIAEGKTKVRPLRVYHGKTGHGLSIEMSVKQGPVTLLSVIQTVQGKLKFLCAHGESVPGPILEIGNTNSRYCFSLGARGFLTEWNSHGPTHHCAVGLGHIAGKLKKLALLLGIEFVQIC
jgi:L-arabinose isomerase